MDVNGSPEYTLTWRHWAIGSLPPICALRGRGRRTSGSGSSGSHIVLTNGERCLVSPEDFDNLKQWSWKKHAKGYAYRSSRKGNIYMHRLILGLKKGAGIADHINRNKLDNRRENLRAVTRSESNHNRQLETDGVTKPKGRNRWTVCLWIDKKFQWLGSFETKEQAIAARVEALLEAGLITPQTLSGWPTPDAHPRGSTQDEAALLERVALTSSSKADKKQFNLQDAAMLATRPTCRAQDGSKGTRTAEAAAAYAEASSEGVDLPTTAQLVGWASPSARDHKDVGQVKARTEGEGAFAERTDQLGRQAQLAGWQTPQASDNKNTSGGRGKEKNPTLRTQAGLVGWTTPCGTDGERGPNQFSQGGTPLAGQLPSGPPSTSSTAGTGRRGVLNPEHSRWLMGYPAAWGCCGATAMRSARRPPRRSSAPAVRPNRFWVGTRDGDPEMFEFFRKHYSAKKNKNPKQRQFVGPGQKLVLRTVPGDALFAWRKFINDTGQEGVNCAVFRNESEHLSSEMIRDAMLIAWDRWPGERLYIYVEAAEVRSVNPGCCFKKAGWRRCGTSKSGLLIFEALPMPGPPSTTEG